jgi:hypothetical protein
MNKVELIAQQLANSINVRNIWGDVIINVKESPYNAIGNGVKDDTVAIQKAVNYANSIGKHDIWMPPGTYKYTTISNTGKITFYGDYVNLVGVTFLEVVSFHSMVDRIDNIVAGAGSSNTEIVDARLPATGSSYPTLKTRLDTENANVNASIAAHEADTTAHNATAIVFTPAGSGISATNVDGAIKEQESRIDNLIIHGDSGPEAADARMSSPYGVTYPTLKDRVDHTDAELIAQKAETTPYSQFNLVSDFNTSTLTGTDNTAAFNSYIQWCSTNKRKVIIPKGKYKVNGEIILPEGITLEGESEAINTDFDGERSPTQLYFTNATGSGMKHDGITRTLTGGIKNIAFINASGNADKILLDLKNVQFAKITGNSFSNIDGNYYYGIGIRLQADGSFNVIEHNKFAYLKKALYFNNTGTGIKSDGNSVMWNSIFHCLKGVYFDGNADGNSLMFNNFAGNSEHDILLDSGEANFIKYNRIESVATIYPIELAGTSAQNKVSDNFISHLTSLVLIKDNGGGGYGANEIKLVKTVNTASSSRIEGFISNESKIGIETGINLFPNSRFPLKSAYYFNIAAITATFVGVDTDGYGIVQYYNSTGADANATFTLGWNPFSASRTGKIVSCGVLVKGVDQTSTTLLLTYGGGALTQTITIDNTKFRLAAVSGYKSPSIAYDQMQIVVKAGKTIQIKMPMLFVGGILNLQPMDTYTNMEEKRFSTSGRPPLTNDFIGYTGYDTTLNKPVWYKGSNVWVDATGASV